MTSDRPSVTDRVGDGWRESIARAGARRPNDGVLARIVLALLIVVLSIAVVKVLGVGDDDEGGGSPAPSGAGAVVTTAYNNGEVTVALNQPFVVNLKGSPAAPWGLPHAESESLAVVTSSEELDGSVSITFVPQRPAPGVVVRAERGGTSPETFAVTIRVVG